MTSSSSKAKRPSIGAAKVQDFKTDFDLGTAFDKAIPDNQEAKPAAEISDKSESTETHDGILDEVIAVADAAAPKAAPKKRAGDRFLSEPAGPTNKYGVSDEGWALPKRDGFVTAMVKLMAFRPGLSNAEISGIIHRVNAGDKSREGTTQVYHTWDLPRAGVGVSRKDGGLHIILPEGHSIDEVKAHPSKKLDTLLTAAASASNQLASDVIDEIEAHNAAIA